jgi:hypothetical protein
MAERVTIPTEADKVSWAEGGAPYPSTDPGAGKRGTGFQPKDNPVPGPGEIITAEDQNFLHRLDGQMLEWLRDTIVREWRDVYEGIAQTDSAGLVFRVTPPVGVENPALMWSRLQAAWSVASTAATVGNPFQVQTDGEQIYYIAGSVNQSLIAAHPATGAEVWEVGIVIQWASMTADGAAVYGMSVNVAEPGLFVLNRDTGAQTANAGAEYGCNALATNGVYCCGINGQVGGAGTIVFYTVATPTETGTVGAFAAAAADLCLDDSTVFTVGPRGVVNDVRAYTLSTRALLWSVDVDTNPFTVNAVCTDGDFIYVGCDSAALAAGGNASIFCLNKSNGAVLWTIDHSDVDELAVDDRYLYAVDSSNNLQMIRLRAPVPAIVGTVGNFGTSIACDGYAVYGNDSFTVTNFRKVWCGGAAKEFMLVNGKDPTRRPFFNLAVPVDGRI